MNGRKTRPRFYVTLEKRTPPLRPRRKNLKVGTCGRHVTKNVVKNASRKFKTIKDVIFEKYWGLQILAGQRDFISKCMVQVQPTYRYQRPVSNRRLNNNFYFEVEEKRVRVCKKFFKATLDINDRPIRTVIAKNEMGFISKDFRGRHNKHKKLDASVKEGIKRHINTIPRIESHYLR